MVPLSPKTWREPGRDAEGAPGRSSKRAIGGSQSNATPVLPHAIHSIDAGARHSTSPPNPGAYSVG